MSIDFYYHPFASFCHKVLIALYEYDIAFTPVLVDLGHPEQAEALRKLWPPGQFPVIVDRERDATIAESTIVIEYLASRTDLHRSRGVELIPADPDQAREVRWWDRIFDLHVSHPMQDIVGDRLRPAESQDAFGLNRARKRLEVGYRMVEARMKTRQWANGDAFSMADCSAAPALFYADIVQPLGEEFPATSAYLSRLCARPSFARVLQESAPFYVNFPRLPGERAEYLRR